MLVAQNLGNIGQISAEFQPLPQHNQLQLGFGERCATSTGFGRSLPKSPGIAGICAALVPELELNKIMRNTFVRSTAVSFRLLKGYPEAELLLQSTVIRPSSAGSGLRMCVAPGPKRVWVWPGCHGENRHHISGAVFAQQARPNNTEAKSHGGIRPPSINCV